MYCILYINICIIHYNGFIVLCKLFCFISVKDARNSDFKDSIKARIRKAFDTSPLEDLKEDEINEEKLSQEVSIILLQILNSFCLYDEY